MSELLIALAIGSLLLLAAGPGYREWIAARQLANHAQLFAGNLNLARSEAIKRGLAVNLGKTHDRRQCADNGGWDARWIMYVDDNRDGEIDGDESVLHVEAPAQNGISVIGNRPIEDYVSYTPTGYARLLNGALQMGTFVAASPGRM